MHDLHRAFLQHLLDVGSVSETQGVGLLDELIRAHREGLEASAHRGYVAAQVDRRVLDKLTSEVNSELEFFRLKVSRAHCAADGKFHYGLVNLEDDEHACKGHSFTPAQIAFFAKIREEIAAGEGSGQEATIDWMDALNFRTKLESTYTLDAGDAEHTLKKLMSENWLTAVGEDEIGLGPRSVLQMQYMT